MAMILQAGNFKACAAGSCVSVICSGNPSRPLVGGNLVERNARSRLRARKHDREFRSAARLVTGLDAAAVGFNHSLADCQSRPTPRRPSAVDGCCEKISRRHVIRSLTAAQAIVGKADLYLPIVKCAMISIMLPAGV